jgi:hypothetical protein
MLFLYKNTYTKYFETSNKEISSIKINKDTKLYAYTSLHEGIREYVYKATHISYCFHQIGREDERLAVCWNQLSIRKMALGTQCLKCSYFESLSHCECGSEEKNPKYIYPELNLSCPDLNLFLY